MCAGEVCVMACGGKVLWAALLVGLGWLTDPVAACEGAYCNRVDKGSCGNACCKLEWIFNIGPKEVRGLLQALSSPSPQQHASRRERFRRSIVTSNTSGRTRVHFSVRSRLRAVAFHTASRHFPAVGCSRCTPQTGPQHCTFRALEPEAKSKTNRVASQTAALL